MVQITTVNTPARDYQRIVFKRSEHKYLSALWLINDGKSHPLWGQYFASLVNLDINEDDEQPVIKYFPEATHELIIHALNPKKGKLFLNTGMIPPDENDISVTMADNIIPRDIGSYFLTPANLAYQLEMKDDDDAVAKVETGIKTAISLDTDYRSSWWDVFFKDHHSLLVGSTLKRKG